ncbi:pseudoazurin [Hoeflea olei]|uniref:Pseudoazurin n=1 Tax=Hoeflea olei TaxID=1480615 RepID=A0A1C1YS11_9HYPH|nr:pseudoazurin [Hoeflea olei]OCW56332.1 pseudoazurin [Hoeflea olei]
MLRTLASALLLATLVGGTALAETVEVRMLNKSGKETMVFEPAFVRIAKGDTIKFVPEDKGHNAESIDGMLPDGAEPFKGKLGKEVEVTFVTPGLYGVECKPHFAMGMVMTVAVGDVTAAPDDFLAGRIPPKAKKRFEDQLANLNN